MARQGFQGNWKDHLLTDDMVAFGMERQLMGASRESGLRPADDSKPQGHYGRSADSVLLAYTNDLKAWAIDLEFTMMP